VHRDQRRSTGPFVPFTWVINRRIHERMDTIADSTLQTAVPANAGQGRLYAALSFENGGRQGSRRSVGDNPGHDHRAENRVRLGRGVGMRGETRRSENWIYGVWTLVVALVLLRILWPWVSGAEGWQGVARRIAEMMS
jgi:hypothetical protein